MPTATANAIYGVSAGPVNMIFILTQLKDDGDEPELLSESERSERIVFRGSGLRHEKSFGRQGTRFELFISLAFYSPPDFKLANSRGPWSDRFLYSLIG